MHGEQFLFGAGCCRDWGDQREPCQCLGGVQGLGFVALRNLELQLQCYSLAATF